MLEEISNYLFLIRPRRFGKSVFVSMMRAYYDIAKADRFDTLFDGLWIKEHPTPLKNAFQIIYFDFSIVGTGSNEQELEQNFNKYCGQVLDVFAEVYASFYDKGFEQEVKKESSARSKLNYRFLITHRQVRSATPPPPSSVLSATLQGRRKAVEAGLRVIRQYKIKKGRPLSPTD